MDLATVIGGFAALASTVSFTPQAWKIIRTRDTSALSAGMYAVTVTGFSLWLIYGLLLMQWPIIITNGLCLLLAAFILMMILLPRRKREAVAETLDPTAG
jgi:MtN3 and saliva related transmembrane protein